jgi:transposase
LAKDKTLRYIHKKLNEDKKMPAPYSNDFRQKIVFAYQNNEGSMNKLAERFKVSVNFVSTLLERFRQTGQVEPNFVMERPNRMVRGAGGQHLIKNRSEKQPDLTLEEIRDCYNEPFDFEPTSRSTIDRTLNRIKITRQKNVI